MKTITLALISISLLSVLIVGCDVDNPTFEGSDNLITITRDFSSFERIIANDDMDVNVTQSDTSLVEIIVNENLQNQLITNVADNALDISLENGSYRNESFTVNILMSNLLSIQIDDNVRANVDFNLSELSLDVSDSATLILLGSSNILNVINEDDGTINGFSFTTEIVNTSSSDAGELEITCNSELNGMVSDAAEVRFRGMPMVNAQTSDAGQIIDAN